MWPAASNRFDVGILRWLNAWVGSSDDFDKGIQTLIDNNLLDSILVSVFWWYWFRKSNPAETTRTREHVLGTLAGGIVAVFAARALALTLPFRVRPRFEPALHFVVPAGFPIELADWSSFPSDHAVMFAALAAGLCFVSWRIGLIALFYAIFLVCFPRVYLGMHYPSDIIAGLSLGVLIGCCMNLAVIRKWLAGPLLRWQGASPAAFYCALFLVSFEFATMFDSFRKAAVAATRLAARLLAFVF